jgi:hypothetical protein
VLTSAASVGAAVASAFGSGVVVFGWQAVKTPRHMMSANSAAKTLLLFLFIVLPP